MENNNTNKREARVQIKPKEGKRVYELRIGSTLNTSFRTEQTDIYLEVTLCCSPGYEGGIVYTLCFSRPQFSSDAEYNKEQWICTKIFDVHRNLVFGANRQGKIKQVLNAEAVLATWEDVKRDLSDSVFGRDTGLLRRMALFGNKLTSDLTAVYSNDLFFQWLCNDMYGMYKSTEAPRATEKTIGGFMGATDLAIQEEKQILFAEADKIMLGVNGFLVPGKMNLEKLNHDFFSQLGATGSKELHFSYAGHYLFTDQSGFFDQAALSVSAVIDHIYNRKIIYSLKAII